MKKRILGIWDYTVILTYLGFCSGIAGIIFALIKKPDTSEPWTALIPIFCLLFCGLCDTFDGAIAKTKKNRSKTEKRFGAQIDSLSDMVCFGVLPAVIGYRIGLKQPAWIAVLVFYCLAALVRLAWFNVEEIEKEVKEAVKNTAANAGVCDADGVVAAIHSPAATEAALTDTAEKSENLGKRKFYTGLPVTNVSWIFPLIFCFMPLLKKNFGYLYVATLLVVGVLFVSTFRIKKLSAKQAIPFIVVCTIVFVGLIVFNFKFGWQL